MKSEWEIEKSAFDREVDAEAARLVREGVSPWQALNDARRNIEIKRRRAAHGPIFGQPTNCK